MVLVLGCRTYRVHLRTHGLRSEDRLGSLDKCRHTISR